MSGPSLTRGRPPLLSPGPGLILKMMANHWTAPPTLLLVDDQALNLKILEKILREEGYLLIMSTSGQEALAKLQTTDVDLCLLDIQMPELDGYELCRRIQSLSKDIPVIFLTALTSPEEVAQGFLTGAVDYVVKPFNALELKARVKTQVELSQARKQTRTLVENLKKTNEELERLIFTVSHDLKAPLHSIQGFTKYICQDLEGGKSPDRALKDARRIHGIAQKALDFITDLLDLARAGLKDVKKDPLAPRTLVEEILADLKPALDEAQTTVHFQGEWGTVTGDKDKVGQIWQNLIQNALKYRRGDVPLDLVFSHKLQENVQWFTLQDNGIGISAENLPKVFSLFEKLDQNSEGSGVGLAIVKKLLDQMGGTITVRSEGQGKGCEFSFSLPLSS